MAKNTVTVAKNAARKAVKGLVDAVKGSGGKPAPLTHADGRTVDDVPRVKKGGKKPTRKDTPDQSAGSKKGKPAGGKRKVRDPEQATRKVKGATLDSVSRVGADDVKRTRASWNGYSLCSLLKWVGFNGGDITNAKSLVASLGLTDTTALSTISCQFYAGRQLALGKKGNPLHTGSPADLTAADAKAVKVMAGM